MEELLELKNLLLAGNIPDALILVEEMTEMSKDDKLNKIFSFSIIVLLHLIKQQAEKRSTRSGETSISNSVRQIQRINQRRKTGGNYLTIEELKESIEFHKKQIKETQEDIKKARKGAVDRESMRRGNE